MRKHSLCTLGAFLLGALLLASPTYSAEAQAGKEVQDKPAKTTQRTTAITIAHEGTDSLGARLAMRLKETFNASNLFSLEEKNKPKIRLYLLTETEFPGRPGVGSVYAAIWTYQQSEGQLAYLLSREVGTVNSDTLEGLVQRLGERSDGIAVKYAYLWPDNS